MCVLWVGHPRNRLCLPLFLSLLSSPGELEKTTYNRTPIESILQRLTRPRKQASAFIHILRYARLEILSSPQYVTWTIDSWRWFSSFPRMHRFARAQFVFVDVVKQFVKVVASYNL